MNVTTIDEVITALDAIISETRQSGHRAGYFAVLYRRMTVAVKEAIAKGAFENGARLERLDVVFAKRYLDAYEAYNAKQPLTASWRVAFDACAEAKPCVLQHLYAGLAAHQLLDLGIAAAEISPGSQIEDLHDDYDHVNTIVNRLMGEIDAIIGNASPLIGILNRAAGVPYATANNVGIYVARGIAWHNAVELAKANAAAREAKIKELDERTALVTKAIVHPMGLPWLVAKVVRMRESRDVRRNIDILEGKKV